MKTIINHLFFFLLCATFVLIVPGDSWSKNIILGFVQVSAEGTWRLTNTKSVQKAAKKAGIQLIYREGDNNYTNQINQMKELILMGVDVLAFSPSQVDGWDDILQKAKNAGIPVIVLDRAINVKDNSLYVTHIGSDMIEEGRRASRWLINYMNKTGHKGEVRIAVLEGVQGSTPAVHRDKGFREILESSPNYKIVRSKPADYIYSKGKEVMSEFLKEESGNIDVVFAHNDEMALGAIEAIEEYGKKPGKDIVVIGVDAIKQSFESMMQGKMNVSIECSPLLGPQLMKAVEEIVSGKKVEKRIITVEKDFDQSNAAEEIKDRVY